MVAGYKALTFPALWVVVLLSVGIMASLDWRKERKPARLWVAVLFFVGGILMSVTVLRQFEFRHELHSLSSEDIVEMRVDGVEVSAPDVRRQIVAALNASTFLNPHECGSGPFTELVLRQRFGRTRTYSVGRCYSGTSIFAINEGKDAYSDSLGIALSRAGTPLRLR